MLGVRTLDGWFRIELQRHHHGVLSSFIFVPHKQNDSEYGGNTFGQPHLSHVHLPAGLRSEESIARLGLHVS